MIKPLLALLPTILVLLVTGTLAYLGIIRRQANLLAFSLALGGLLGWTIGYATRNPLSGVGIGAFIGILCVLPVKNFVLRGRPAIITGTGWILIAIGWMVLRILVG